MGRARGRRGRALPEAFLESVLGGEGRGAQTERQTVEVWAGESTRRMRAAFGAELWDRPFQARAWRPLLQGEATTRALLGPHRLLRVGVVMRCWGLRSPRQRRHVLPRGYQCKPPLAPWAESTAFAGTGSNRLALDAAAQRRALERDPLAGACERGTEWVSSRARFEGARVWDKGSLSAGGKGEA